MNTYEFSEEENKEFSSFALSMAIFASSMTLLGILSFLDPLISKRASFVEVQLRDVIVGIIVMVMGLLTFLPIRGFKSIVETTGNDMKELMKAFSAINRGMTVLLTIASILAILILFLSFED